MENLKEYLKSVPHEEFIEFLNKPYEYTENKFFLNDNEMTEALEAIRTHYYTVWKPKDKYLRNRKWADKKLREYEEIQGDLNNIKIGDIICGSPWYLSKDYEYAKVLKINSKTIEAIPVKMLTININGRSGVIEELPSYECKEADRFKAYDRTREGDTRKVYLQGRKEYGTFWRKWTPQHITVDMHN